ncbi:MAG: DUF3108 domain-containing protein [Myxococcota bacterium]
MRSMLSGILTVGLFAAAGGSALAEEGEHGWKYELHALGSKAGEAVVVIGVEEAVGRARVRPIRIDAHTEGFATNFLDATSMATTWVDQSWLPVRSRWDQRFDKVSRVIKATYTPKGVTGTDERDGKIFESPNWQIGQHPMDVVSVFAYLARAELSPGNRFEIPVFDGRRIYTVSGTVGVAKEIQLPVGFRKAIPLRATVTRGEYKRNIELWISAEKDRTPLKLVFKYGLLGEVEALFVGDYKSGS